MMRMRVHFVRLALVLIAFVLLVLLGGGPTTAQDQSPQPRTVHNACAGNCVADTIFLHSGMGDTQARNAYHGWFGSYYELAGCGDPAWKTDLLFLIDIVGDAVGAPGAPTMQCWQGLAAQASLCRQTCSEYFIADARYAPNVKLSLDQGSPGYHEVTLDNQSNLGKLPELQPNAYSRKFKLKTYLQYENGEPLLVNETPMPSLSFPNWITRGGLDNCIDHYGFDSARCSLITDFATPSVVSTSVEFLDGVLYDLSSQINDLSDANGSFSQDGYIRLLSDGDAITIAQGPYAGYVLVKTHYLSNDAHTVQLMPWDASGRSLTITNHECNTWLSTCWVTGTRHDTDTYVYAVYGPQDKVLDGMYTVEVVADIPHEKDFSDNRVSYVYDASSLVDTESGAGGTSEGGGAGPGDQPPGVGDLRVIDIPGPGIWPATIGPDVLGYLFRISVPDEVFFMVVRLVPLDGSQMTAYVRRGSIPVPNYPTTGVEYDCRMVSDASYFGGCSFSNPPPEDYFIFVHRDQGGGAYQLEVEWAMLGVTPTVILTVPPTGSPTQPPTAQPTGSPTLTPAGLPDEQESTDDSDTQTTLDEVEPNDAYDDANTWDMQGPFTGQFSPWYDVDVLRLNFSESGIYTLALTDVAPPLRAKMTLARIAPRNVVDSVRAGAAGGPVYLTLDASVGEQYYLLISVTGMSADATNMLYTVSIAGFIPDPDEPNDSLDTATFWDLATGPVTGYFWDKTTGRHDTFTFVAPPTMDASPITFTLTNPAPDLRMRLTVLRQNGQFVFGSSYSAPGESVTVMGRLDAGQQYALKLETQFDRTSLQPYTLSAQYEPAASEPTATPPGGAHQDRPAHVYGIVYLSGDSGTVPIEGVAIHVAVGDQPPILLDVSDSLGAFGGTVLAAEGETIRTWAVKKGMTFQPAEDLWSPEPRRRSHRVDFVATGTVVQQQTPTHDGSGSATPQPTLTATATSSPTSSPTPPLPTATPTPAPPVTVISGTVWRLFPDSGPAGVAAARVIAAVNGVEQPGVLSTIDGSYRIELAGLQPGDQLSLRAAGTEDVFEPLTYQWQAEAGVEQWYFDFYSYWGNITPPERDDQNRIYGTVRNGQGVGVPGVMLLLQMGISDALQVLGPTDANGYYETFVRLPSRVMVTVWPQSPGYLPSRVQFFHAYAPEDREVSFFQAP